MTEALAELKALMKQPGVVAVIEGARGHPTTEPAARLLWLVKIGETLLAAEGEERP